MYNENDIKWVKSITRDKGENWAYMEFEVGDIFGLNFSKNPKWYPTNYLKAKPNELIVLFQTLLPNKLWYVTHLVSPIDNEISKVDSLTHPYVRQVCVVGKANNPNPINDNLWSFYKCSRGQICNIFTIERRFSPDFSLSEKQIFVWNLYTNSNPSLDEEINCIQNEQQDNELMSVMEGEEKTMFKVHKYRERNSKIVSEAKLIAKKQKRLYCEICLFNFEKEYPGIGIGFIECHHKQPISKGGLRPTTVKDLALVCSNCHRMLHRKEKNGEYYSIEQLKALIN